MQSHPPPTNRPTAPAPGCPAAGADKVVIGREPSENVTLVLGIPTVSSTHAMIDCVDGDYYLTDLSSTNGTFIDGPRPAPGACCGRAAVRRLTPPARGPCAGEELAPGKPAKLERGAEVVFGDEYLAKFVLETVGGGDDDNT